MSINGATQKLFMERVYREGNVNLNEALDVFYKSRNQRNTENILSTLRVYGNNSEIIFVDKQNGNECLLSKEVIENAGDYEVVFNKLGLSEQQLCEMRSLSIDDIKIDHIDDSCFMAFIGQSHFSIYGEIENCMIQYERLRAFTNMVAQHLVGRRFDKVSSKFSEHVSSKFTPEFIENKFVEKEKTYGKFDFFDRVEIQSIYSGKDRDKKYFDDEKLPKGIKRSQRVGTAFFQLLSDYTPNGVSHWDYTVSVSVIEEEKDLFKLYDLKYLSTY
jgi:hypothetical protein